jgi:hypothetical protein
LIKEEDSYKKEYDNQLKRIEKVKQETPDDDWNIRKQVRTNRRPSMYLTFSEKKKTPRIHVAYLLPKKRLT